MRIASERAAEARDAQLAAASVQSAQPAAKSGDESANASDDSSEPSDESPEPAEVIDLTREEEPESAEARVEPGTSPQPTAGDG
jgi:hypothetical protein